MKIASDFLSGLPNADSARHFLEQFAERHPSTWRQITKDSGLLTDLLALAAYSPWAASTLLSYPEYAIWLKKHRTSQRVRGKDDLLESLARFALTNSSLDPSTLLPRFKNREYLRIFLNDLRGRTTIAETTEELSNLADTLLEYSLRIARQEMENRYGIPMESDGYGRLRPASIAIVSLGKLGSRELNYASDIDLLFLFSADGNTTGTGTAGSVSNREFFIRLAGRVAAIVGGSGPEGAAYRVDLRLRPYGRAGMLAVSVAEAIKYYNAEAADWERQVLIRSRASAGDEKVFADFLRAIAPFIFADSRPISLALEGVRKAKERIDREHGKPGGFDVKLGRGGIREIEFIAQALQSAYGGRDKWLRAAHTLIALQRLNDRGLIDETELAGLTEAYKFLRRTEHLLQMEHGLQTHVVPEEPSKRHFLALRMGFSSTADFDAELFRHKGTVAAIFNRVFNEVTTCNDAVENDKFHSGWARAEMENAVPEAVQSNAASGSLITICPRLANAGANLSHLAEIIANPGEATKPDDYCALLSNAIESANTYREKLNALRHAWRPLIHEILALDASGKLTISESKRHQTELAEASIAVAMKAAVNEYLRRSGSTDAPFMPVVLGLGKIGSRGLDFDSDLDLVITFDEPERSSTDGYRKLSEAVVRTTEIFVNLLSAFTRLGSLYRVDLRLRPFGESGPLAIGRKAMANYFRQDAAIWELLAFVKVRGLFGPSTKETEQELRELIHSRARDIGADILRSEIRRIRLDLQKKRIDPRRATTDIKYAEGGMLDIYFATRYLQLRDMMPDTENTRSTTDNLKALRDAGSLGEPEFKTFWTGYDFLSRLDHHLRVMIGRTTRIPVGNRRLIEQIAEKMNTNSVAEFERLLTLTRMEIRSAFDAVLGQ